MFIFSNPYGTFRISRILRMYNRCPVCHQPFDLEPGFWFGTSYVSYGVTIVISAITFFLWWFVVGISLNDDRIAYWLIFNSVLIIALQPLLMRLSRWIVLGFFVHYDEDWDKNEVVKLR